MKYILKYPNMNLIHEEIEGTIRGSSVQHCHWCKEPTEFVNIYYEAAFCSDECLNIFELQILESEEN